MEKRLVLMRRKRQVLPAFSARGVVDGQGGRDRMAADIGDDQVAVRRALRQPPDAFAAARLHVLVVAHGVHVEDGRMAGPADDQRGVE